MILLYFLTQPAKPKSYSRIESTGNSVGLHLNSSETKYVAFNIDNPQIQTTSGQKLEQEDDLYLGVWSVNSENDITTRMAKAGTPYNCIGKILSSSLIDNLKWICFLDQWLKKSQYVEQKY